MSDAERYYDDVIAPKLAELATDAKAHGLSFLAVVEWEPGEYGRTLYNVEGSSFYFRLVDLAARAQGNVDALWMAIKRHATMHGHSSIYLELAGVPRVPKQEAE